MKIELSDVSGLPDALKDLVQTEGDKSSLDLLQLAPASELEKFKGKALTAQQEAIDRRKALDAWKALGETPDDVKSALEAKAKPDPDQARIVEQMKTAHTQELAALQEKLTKTFKRQAVAELKAALAENGVVPEGLDLLAGYAASRIQFNDDGTPKVLSRDGSTPMIGNGPNGGATLSDLAKELAGSIPHLVTDKGAGGGGKPPNSTGGKSGKTMARAEFDRLDPAQKMTVIKDGTAITD